jgi:hypothetical protein
LFGIGSAGDEHVLQLPLAHDACSIRTRPQRHIPATATPSPRADGNESASESEGDGEIAPARGNRFAQSKSGRRRAGERERTGGVVEEEANAQGAHPARDSVPAHPHCPLIHHLATCPASAREGGEGMERTCQRHAGLASVHACRRGGRYVEAPAR